MRADQIINETDLYINADKGSRAKRVHVPELRQLLVKCKSFGLQPFKGITRFQVYRMYKRLGIVHCNGVNKNKSVTHTMRKEFVQDNHRSTKNIEVTADLVGHKSIKSTEYYVKKTKS